MQRRHGREAWQGPFPIQVGTYAVWPNLQLNAGLAHLTFRSSPSHSIIAYRSLSLGQGGFEQDRELEISVAPSSGREVANANSLLVGPFGGRTVLYSAATQRGPGNGQLVLAYAEAGGAWQTTVLAEDPPMRSGNVPHDHFVLVRGPGRQAIALYSKVGEQHRVLYRRIVENGRPMEPEREIARSELAGAYERLTGMRDSRLTTGLLALVCGNGAGATLGVRAVLAPRPVTTRWR